MIVPITLLDKQCKASPVVGVIKHGNMVISGHGLVSTYSLQMPLHAVRAHPVHVIGLGLVLEQQTAEDIQPGAILADAVAGAHPASVIDHCHSPIILGQALGNICLTPVLHVIAHLQGTQCNMLVASS